MEQREPCHDRPQRHRSLRQSRRTEILNFGTGYPDDVGCRHRHRNDAQRALHERDEFGALSVPEGRVDICWTLDQQAERLHFAWTERNGAAVSAPKKRSFGTRLIETLGRQLRGDVQLTYERTGLVYTFDVPMASLTSAAA
jgi:hypothetical protein